MSFPTETSPNAESGASFNPLVVVLPDARGKIDPSWLNGLKQEFRADMLAPAGAGSIAGLGTLDVDWRDTPALVRAVAVRAGDDGALVVTSGLLFHPYFALRLARLARAGDRPPLFTFAGNQDDSTNPAAGLGDTPDAAWCDAVANAAGLNRWTPVDHSCSRCFFVSGKAPDVAGELADRSQAWLYDGLYIHDPQRPVTAGQFDRPDIMAALGDTRLALYRLLEAGDPAPLPWFGCDSRPVTLHISHDWGGGVARWISDLIEGDEHGNHLILAASGHTGSLIHGQRLKLYAAGPGRAPVREWVLTPAIAGTVGGHPHYAGILAEVIRRFGIGRIMVSSLIGHSLDALRTGLPTVQVLHDYYPAWPVLDHDPLEFARGEKIDLAGAIDQHGEGFLFRERDAGWWQALADQWQQVVLKHDIALIAPTDQVVERWRRLCGKTVERTRVVPHGFTGWPGTPPEIRSRPLKDGNLNLVVVGRLSPGKGLGLLEQALPRLRKLARITLLGCGHHGMRLFGQSGVDIVLDYERDRLPRMLAALQPQAVLFLSTVAETWNYVLTETRSLGLVPIATRTGSFIERIGHDQDGLLFDPDPDSLVETVASLRDHPERLEALAASLPSEPGMAETIAIIDAILPAAIGPAPTPLAATGSTEQAAAMGAGLADARLRISRLEARVEHLTEDLAERTTWARKYERLTHERAVVLHRQEADIKRAIGQLEERTRWIQSLEEDLYLTRDLVRQLEQNLEAVYASRSWRMTRPVRFASRVLANARRNRAFNPLRWPHLIGRLIYNLRHHGPRLTLQLMQQEESAREPSPAQAPAAAGPATTDPPVAVTLEPGTRPRASIIVPVYNKVEYTAACLQALATHTPAGAYEVIVVDDCSTDETASYLASCNGICVIRNEANSGFIHSCNAGAGAARGEFLVFLNNDTAVTEGWMTALLDPFDRNAETGIVGARLVYPDGTLQEAGGIIFNDASGWNYGRGDNPDLPQYNFLSETDYVSGACLAIRRTDFEQLDGFDPHFAPAYYEDTDLCFRVRALGKKVIYQPAATVIHYEGVSSGTDESSGTKRYQAINRDKFRSKWAEVLVRQPAPKPNPTRKDPVRHLRYRRYSKRLLVIDAVTPQPDHDSGSVRIMAMMNLLGEMGYQVSFLPENRMWVDGYSADLQQAGIEVLHAPALHSLDEWLDEHGRDLDAVIVSRHYVLTPIVNMIRRQCPQARLVFDTVDLHFLREQREAEVTGSDRIADQAAATRTQELALIERADVTLVVSAAEQDLLGELLPNANVRVVSNIHQVHGSDRGWDERSDLLFVGGFQHVPNIDAAKWLVDEIFPRVRARVPEINLHLIGSRMPPEFVKLNAPGVLVHGFVPDLMPYLAGCRVSLAPLRYGAGVKGKVNQAMSHGLPVVASPCAAEGMFLTHGEDVLIGEDAEALAECIVAAYTDEALWTRLSQGGLDNVEKHFSINAARQALIEALQIES